MSRSNYSPDSGNMILKIVPSGSSILPYVFGIILGLLLIIATIIFDIKFNTINYYYVLMVIIFYFIIDYGYKKRNNIRLIELQEKTLNIYRGKKMLKESIPLSIVIGIKSKKRLLSVVISLQTERADNKKPTSTLISSDNIPNHELLKLFEEIKRLKKMS